MSDYLGPGVSRTLSAKARQFLNIVWQKGKPPLDSEFNLLSQVNEEARQALLQANTASGWIGNEFDAMSDYDFDPLASNLFWLGKNKSGTEADILWANVNGWLVPVTGTNSSDTRNTIKLPPPEGAVSDSDVNFVFLEVWKAQVSPDGTVNKPAENKLYKYGNVEYGGSNLDNDLLDPAMLFETTERVQLQYRLRVVGDVNPATSPYGFDSSIRGQGALASPTTNPNPAYNFENMADELGDPGLWRAGTGDGKNGEFDTVDGYVYAVPLCFVFRRTSLSWTKSSQHGAVDRNPNMSDRSEAKVLPKVSVVADVTPSAMTFDVDTTQSATTFNPSGGLVQVGKEVIAYSDFTGTTFTVSERGAKGTHPTLHESGTQVRFVTGHPLGLFSDQITSDDVLDLRHMIGMKGVDYNGLLTHNFNRLIKNELHTTWKKSSADVKGKKHFQVDYLGPDSNAPDHTIKADKFDGFRKIFSDACTLQPNNMLVLGSDLTGAVSTDLTTNPTQVTISRRSVAGWHTNDVVEIDLNQFRSTFNVTDDNKVRFVHPFEYDDTDHDAVRLWFGETDPISTTNVLQDQLSIAAGDSNPHFVVLGKAPDNAGISTEGQNDLTFKTAVTSLSGGDAQPIEFGAGAIDFSVAHPDGGTVGDYLASIGAWVVITAGTDDASTDPDNHGAFEILGHDGSDLLVTCADTNSPAFVAATNNRNWVIRLPECTEYDDNLYVALADRGFTGAPQFSASTMSLAYDVLYHPSRGLSRVPEQALQVDFIPTTPSNYLRENDFENAADSPVASVKRTLPVSLATYPHKWDEFQYRGAQDLRDGVETVWSESYVDAGSKSLLFQPVRKVEANLEPQPSPTVAYSDVTGDWDLSNGSDTLLLPKELRAPLGRQDLPFVTDTTAVADDSTDAAYGVNHLFLAGTSEAAPGLNRPFVKQRLLAVYDPFNTTPSTDFGNYESLDNLGNGPAGLSALVCRFYEKGGVRGIEIPAHYGIARLFGAYIQQDFYDNNGDSAFTPTSNYRALSGAGPENMLREDGERRSLIITDENTFVIPEDVIDLNRLHDGLSGNPDPCEISSTSTMIFEFDAFFFDNWTSDFMRVHRLANAATPSTTFNLYINGPAENNVDAFVVSTRVPYQGNVNNTMPVNTTNTSTVSANDYMVKRRTEEQTEITDLSTPFADKDAVRFENRSKLEILAAKPFATTIGTGVMSGPVVPGSYTDIGYLSPEGYPFTDANDPERPAKVRALPHPVDSRAITPPMSETLCGLSERLPLGLISADYQLLGEGMTGAFKRLWTPDVSLEGPIDYKYDQALSKTLLEGAVVMSDGTSGGGPSGTMGYANNLNVYRTYRGGAVMAASGDHEGGAVVLSGGRTYKEFPYLTNPRQEDLQVHGGMVFGVALLVRTQKEVVTDDAIEANYGDELQMLVITGLTLGKEIDLSGNLSKEFVDFLVQMHPIGVGEGYAAADRYRVEGRPLLKTARRGEDALDIAPYRQQDPSKC